MSWITELFSSSVGGVVEKVGNVIDELHTSEEEKLRLKGELIKIKAEVKLKEVELENQYQQEITKRWESDNKSDSWLAKNIRPLSLAYMLGVVSVFALFDGNIGEFKINESYVALFETLMVVAFAAYFGGRTLEKRK